jgi:RNA polymerase sigma-70 factor (ECF subfamily)
MRDFGNASDDDLLRDMAAGDEAAFVALYRRYQGSIYRFTLHMTGDPAAAEEITQEVFMFLIRRTRQYDAARGSLAGFLIGIARNHVLRRLERERMYASAPDDSHVSEHDVLGDILRSRRIDAMRKALLALPEHYREVLILCDLEEMDYAQVAELLSCPVGTVRSRLNRARAMLTSKLRSMERCPA